MTLRQAIEEIAGALNNFETHPVPSYTVAWCFSGTLLSVSSLTYDEAWKACDLHSKAGRTVWVETEA